MVRLEILAGSCLPKQKFFFPIALTFSVANLNVVSSQPGKRGFKAVFNIADVRQFTSLPPMVDLMDCVLDNDFHLVASKYPSDDSGFFLSFCTTTVVGQGLSVAIVGLTFSYLLITYSRIVRPTSRPTGARLIRNLNP